MAALGACFPSGSLAFEVATRHLRLEETHFGLPREQLRERHGVQTLGGWLLHGRDRNAPRILPAEERRTAGRQETEQRGDEHRNRILGRRASGAATRTRSVSESLLEPAPARRRECPGSGRVGCPRRPTHV